MGIYDSDGKKMVYPNQINVMESVQITLDHFEGHL